MVNSKQKEEFILRLNGKLFGGTISNYTMNKLGSVRGIVYNTWNKDGRSITYGPTSVFFYSKMIEYATKNFVVTNDQNHNFYYEII